MPTGIYRKLWLHCDQQFQCRDACKWIVGVLRIAMDHDCEERLGHELVALVDSKPLIIPGRTVKAVDTTGAGDCFVGAVAAQLAGGRSIGDALEYANVAASICVQRMGAAPSMPSAAEVEAILSAGRPGEGRDP